MLQLHQVETRGNLEINKMNGKLFTCKSCCHTNPVKFNFVPDCISVAHLCMVWQQKFIWAKKKIYKCITNITSINVNIDIYYCLSRRFARKKSLLPIKKKNVAIQLRFCKNISAQTTRLLEQCSLDRQDQTGDELRITLFSFIIT